MVKLLGRFRSIKSFLGWQFYAAISNNPSKLAAKLRARILRTSCFIDSRVLVENYKNFNCGSGSALYFGTHILNHLGQFSLGQNSHLGAGCHVNVCKGNIQIGDNVAIGPNCTIVAYSNSYEPGKLVVDCRIQEDIKIGNNVFIGANCVVLPGTEISDNVVIGAGSVVKGKLQPNSLYVGAPCKFKKQLS